jgi:hypothetical protein
MAAALLRCGHDPVRVTAVTRVPLALVQFLAEHQTNHPTPPDPTADRIAQPSSTAAPGDPVGRSDQSETMRIGAITGLARISGIGIAAAALDPGPAGDDPPGRSLDSPSTGSGGAVERLRRHRWALPALTLAVPTDLAVTAISGSTGDSGLSAASAFVALGLLTALGWCAARG